MNCYLKPRNFNVLQVVRQMAELLWSKAYGEPVLEGFIASAGGLDGRLRRSVASAIAEQLAGVRPVLALAASLKMLEGGLLNIHTSSID